MTMILSRGRLAGGGQPVLAAAPGCPAVERPANLPEDPQSPVRTDGACSACRARRLPPGAAAGPALPARCAERSAACGGCAADAAHSQPACRCFPLWGRRLRRARHVAQADSDDAVARVVLAFDGDLSRLNARNRMLFDLAHTLTGEMPPYATLMYVGCAVAPVGSVIVSSRSDCIRKIVVESGRGRLNGWLRA